MNAKFLKHDETMKQAFCIIISEYTNEDKVSIFETLHSCRASVIHSSDMIAIFCKDEQTFNWLSLKWQ